ncbi:hypothetical protein [Pseudoduganella chitinolytica]|uniref:DUF3829 domain-containing protein n=1 Tax=Pseudoduganella chitinolytica TaxID=34070 RepID=A0ABY8BM07_9BURK|nr:hypothetical protein [Pseudoduganella chitinolytica]WEF35404.1 hypothetical protein PX653_11820 [Pseudoduganella chitinolytica]
MHASSALPPPSSLLRRCWQLALLALLLAGLTGCAGQRRLEEVRQFAALSPTLTSYAELSQRYRDTYQREQPYLTAAAAQREKAIDEKRRDAYPDFMAIQQAVVAYMRALGAMAGSEQFRVDDQVKAAATGIKTWPDAGITDRHVSAYAGLTRLLARLAGGRQQDQAVQAMLREGYEPMQASLEAMSTVLRHYDKTHDNERAIVLGMLDVETSFADNPHDRLLAVLAKAHRQEKASEYRLLGLRHTLAARHVHEIQTRHQALVQGLEGAPASVRVATPAAVPTATGALP